MLTEWLAEALRISDGFRHAFLKHFQIELNPDTSFDVRTQFPISVASDGDRNHGFIDLALLGQLDSVFVEVKWGSDESGDQLKRYQDYCAAIARRGRLGYLTRNAMDSTCLSCTPDVLLTWGDVGQMLRDAATSDPSRLEPYILRSLREFLETMMPPLDLNLRAVAASTEIQSLLGFLHETLSRSCIEVGKRWPFYDKLWSGIMEKFLYEQLMKSARVATYKNIGHFSVYIGVCLSPEPDYDKLLTGPSRYLERFPWVSCWIETAPRYLVERSKIAPMARQFAEANKGIGWYCNDVPDAWRVLYRLEPLVAFQTHADPSAGIVDWLVKSFEQLDAGGILSALDQFHQ